MKDSIRYGVIGSLIYIICQLFVYFIGQNLMFSWSGIFLLLGVITLVAVFGIVSAMLSKKRTQKGFISFKEAFREGFIVVVIISALIGTFNYVLYNFIDPGLVDMLRDFTVEGTASWIEGSVSEAQFDEIMEEVESRDYSVTIKNTLGQMAGGILMGSVPNLIAAAAMKKVDLSKQADEDLL